jgi:hypothetical protein
MEVKEMKILEFPCKTCLHKKVCGFLAQTTNLVCNINTDIDSGNYPGNVELHLSCVDYVAEEDRRVR